MSTSDPAEKSKKGAETPAPRFERLHLKSHRDLITRRAEIFKRVRDNPELARLLVLNPVLAFEEMGLQASPELRHHILSTVQHPTQVRQRREELESKLETELGQKPQPNDPGWVSRVLFKDLKVKPLNTEGLKPIYLPLANEATLRRLNHLRPPSRQRYHYEPSISAGSALEMKPWQPSLRYLDLDAPLPKLKTIRVAPKEVPLEQLYFYKGSHPLAHDLLELGIILRSSFNFASRANIRRIKEGKVDNALYRWVKSIRFPEEKPK